MARVTNKAKASRTFVLASGRSATLHPGTSDDLDLADHPVHDAWIAGGEVEVEAPVSLEPYGPPPPPEVAIVSEEPAHERKRQRRGNAR